MFYFCGVHLCAFFNIRNLASFSGVCLTTIGLGSPDTTDSESEPSPKTILGQSDCYSMIISNESLPTIRTEPTIMSRNGPVRIPTCKIQHQYIYTQCWKQLLLLVWNRNPSLTHWPLGDLNAIHIMAFSDWVLIGIFRSSHDNALGWMAWCCTTLHPLTRILTRYVNGSINVSDNIQCSSWTHGVTCNLHIPCVYYPEY